MKKSKLLGQMLRLLITLVGAGIGAIAATMVRPFLLNAYPHLFSTPGSSFILYLILCGIGAVILFAFSYPLMQHMLRLSGMIERRFSSMPTRQIFLTALGLILGLVVAALIHLLILSMGSSLLTVSISAIVYVVLGTMGMRIGFQRYYSKPFSTHGRRRRNTLDLIMDETLDEEEDEPESDGEEPPCTAPAKVLDTSVLIDGRILDIADTGFLEGDLVIAEFVLDELRHIADSADSLKRTRGRRGLDIVRQLQNRLGDRVVLHTPRHTDDSEVDVRLLKLCRELGGVVVTNDYNLNKVARISGVKALNINDLANALKPMLATGEEITVEIVREGKEAGQGVAYLDDGTMIVVDHAKPLIGHKTDIMVTTVLQTSAGRMIFAALKETANGKEA